MRTCTNAGARPLTKALSIQTDVIQVWHGLTAPQTPPVAEQHLNEGPPCWWCLAPEHELLDRLLRLEVPTTATTHVAGIVDQSGMDESIKAEIAASACRLLPVVGETPAGIKGKTPAVHLQPPQQCLKSSQGGEHMQRIHLFEQLLDRTAFAMAQQDVRYFLNGMLIEISGDGVRVVATDGHRLATSVLSMDHGVSEVKQVIIPRKGILELQRMLSDEEGDVDITLGSNHLRARASQMTLTTKLVDGKFPDYNRVIPKDGNKVISAEREVLRQALSRTAILSNEKFRGIRLNISDQQIQLSANNPEQEEAEELVSVDYGGVELEIGFNVGYLLDALGVAEGKEVRVTLNDANSPALIESPDNEQSVYVVMPMKL